MLDTIVLGRVAQSVGHLTRKSGSWVRYPVWQHTFVSPSAFSRRAVVSYWRKYVHVVLVNRLEGLSLPRKSVVRLTDRPDMTLDVYRGRKKQYNNNIKIQSYPSKRLSSVISRVVDSHPGEQGSRPGPRVLVF